METNWIYNSFDPTDIMIRILPRETILEQWYSDQLDQNHNEGNELLVRVVVEQYTFPIIRPHVGMKSENGTNLTQE